MYEAGGNLQAMFELVKEAVDAFFGMLKPLTVADAWATAQPDGTWILDGLMPLNELKSRLEIKELNGEDRGLFNTLGGFILAELGYLPKVGDILESEGWHFEVNSMVGRRIDKVIAKNDK
jgi:putative hemolysin